MMLLALRNLVAEKTRFAFSAAGIGFAVFLITILLGLYQGWNQKVGGFVEKVQGDAWVAREGTTDFINAASILPASLGDSLRSNPDIEGVYPLIVRPMSFRKDGHKVDIHLIGYEPATGVGGPLHIIEGRGDPQGDEIVVDQVLARVSGVKVGDTLTSGESEVKVIGIASGGNFAFTQAGFMNIEGARALLEMQGLSTFFVVKMRAGTDIPAWQHEISSTQPGVVAFTSSQFASATRHRILDQVIPIIGLIVGLAFIVGIAITSLTIYTATVERTREFGVMKAIGFNNIDLYKLVLSQSLLTGMLGFVFGALATLLVSMFIDRIVAQFIVLVRPFDIGFVLIATLLMAFGAAIVPARRVAGVDPAVAFKG
ncbi:MAG TPA: FtsX-like permease family protein [Dehalococcoidia bacterium]|nr:FtsX-like permease family protein [Dehalococcoidia bacterium]